MIGSDHPEGQPDEQGDKGAGLLEVLQFRRAPAPGAGAEGQAPAEGGHEPVGADRHRGGVAEDGQRQHRDPDVLLGRAAETTGAAEQPPADGAHGGPGDRPEKQLDGGREAAVVRLEADGGGSARNGEHHHGGGDAVVEPALDGDQFANPTRNRGVGHHRNTERGIRRCQCGTDQQGEPDAEVREEPRRQTPPEQDRQGKADAEEPTVGAEVSTHLRKAQPGGIREEHPHECDLDERRQLFDGLHAAHQPAPREQTTDAHEHDRRREAGTAGAR